jgi:hypothetical protein
MQKSLLNSSHIGVKPEARRYWAGSEAFRQKIYGIRRRQPPHLPSAPTTLPTMTATSLSQVFSSASPFVFELAVPAGGWLPLTTHSLIASRTLFLLLRSVLALTPPLLTISMTFVLRLPASVRQKYEANDPVSRLERSGSRKLVGG